MKNEIACTAILTIEAIYLKQSELNDVLEESYKKGAVLET